MRDEEVIKRLMEYQPEEPDADAMKQCMALLPQVKTSPGIWSLLRTQAGFLSALIYAISLLLYLAAGIAAAILNMTDFMTTSSMLPVLILALIAGQINWAGHWEMRELERCCRYSYGQLLLARIVCIGAWMFLLNGMLGVVFMTIYHTPIAKLFVWLMPTVIASAAALMPETCFRIRSNWVRIIVFLAAAVLVNQAIPMLLNLSGWLQELSVAFFFMALAAAILQGMVGYRRRVMDEAYSM